MQEKSGKPPFLYQKALVRSDIRLLAFGAPVIITELVQVLTKSVWFKGKVLLSFTIKICLRSDPTPSVASFGHHSAVHPFGPRCLGSKQLAHRTGLDRSMAESAQSEEE